MKNSNVFELLIKNNQDEIHEFLISNGKAPKAVSPVRFFTEEELLEMGK